MFYIAPCSNASYYIQSYIVTDLGHIGLMSHMTHIACFDFISHIGHIAYG